jgi:hypothetical protein
MRTRLALTTGLAAATLLVLTGCFGGTGGTDGTGSGGTGDDGSSGSESGGSGSLADCLQGSWDLDEQDLARQLAESMSGGVTVLSSEASGGVHMTVDGDQMRYVSDVTFTMTVDGGDGLILINNQLQAGESSGTFSTEGDTIVFSEWNGGITITNTVTVDGQESTTTSEIPAEGGVPMVITCDGDLMSTNPDASPYTSVWSRE